LLFFLCTLTELQQRFQLTTLKLKSNPTPGRGYRGYVGHGAIMYKAIKTCKIRLKIVKLMQSMFNYVLFIIQTLFLEIVIYFSCSMGNLKNRNLKKYLRRLVFYFIDT
jgi:hypothetical protein